MPRLDGGTLDEGTLTWLELCKRTQEEKREEAMAKEALQLEAQELSAKVAALEEKVAVLEADSERERLLAEAERALVALRAEHAEQLAACEQREAELVATQQRVLPFGPTREGTENANGYDTIITAAALGADGRKITAPVHGFVQNVERRPYVYLGKK